MSEQPGANPDLDLTVDSSNDGAEVHPNVIRARIIPGIAIVVIVAFLGLLSWSLFAPESARTNTSTLIGNAIVYDDPQEAPEFSMTTLDGSEQIALSDLRGRTVLINFWAAWCEPCRNEMPLLNQANAQFDDDVVLLGINTQDDPDDGRAFVAELGVPYPVLDETTSVYGPVGVEYGVRGIPESFLIGKEGKLIALYRGEFKGVSDINDFVALAP